MIKVFLVFLLFANLNAKADNGSVAYAYPMNHVIIDGNLSDWPTEFNKYPINLVHTRGSFPESPVDFNAYFMVGYNLENNSIYIAIEVDDESHVIDYSINPEWSNQDKHLLYLDPKHSRRGSCPISYSATEIRREIGGSSFGWDPQTNHATWDNIELKIIRQGNKTIYEYRIELEVLSSNKVLGFDHVLYDKDESKPDEKYSYIMWGDYSGKSGAPGRTGDLILLEANEKLASISGNVTFAQPQLLKEKQIRINSVEDADFWLTVKLDSTGNYSTKIPYGNYYLDFPNAILSNEEETELRIDQTQRLNFSANKPAQTLDQFVVSTKPKPSLAKDKGLLFDFLETDKSLVDEFMKMMMDHHTIPGASLGLIVDGKLVYHNTYGVKNTLTQEPVVENTIFQAASITKPVFAYTVLRLSDKGIIDLDRPLYEYLPFEELKNDIRYKKMTARHVLSHQTGLPNWGRKLNFEPGTAFGYSGEGFEYLKRVVEKITNRSILNILEEEVLIPFKMTENTYFVREPEMYSKAAFGHNYNLPTTNWIINRVGMARSMYTESKEFTNFILALMNGVGLSKETYNDMLKSQIQIPKDETNPVADWKRSMGLGILKKESPFGNCFGHGGSNTYFQSLFEYYKDKKVGFVVFCNNDMGWHLGNDLREFLIIGK